MSVLAFVAAGCGLVLWFGDPISAALGTVEEPATDCDQSDRDRSESLRDSGERPAALGGVDVPGVVVRGIQRVPCALAQGLDVRGLLGAHASPPRVRCAMNLSTRPRS